MKDREKQEHERSAAVTGFKHPALQQLTDQQVRFAPLARRLEQADQARRLLGEIEAGKRYPYQFVCFRVTGFRPDAHAGFVDRRRRLGRRSA